MTVREIYEAVLVELNKEDAQSFTIEEFNYILNKSILAFVNEKYNFYPANQQLSDDLRVLVKQQIFNVRDNDVDLGLPAVSYTYNPSSATVVEVTGPTTLVLSNVYDVGVNSYVRLGVSTRTYRITAVNDNEITVNRTIVGDPTNMPVLLYSSSLYTATDGTGGRVVEFTIKASDYFHLISCRTKWRSIKKSGEEVSYAYPAKRLTFDMMNAIENNAYLKPAPNRPYYQIFDNIYNSGSSSMPTEKVDYDRYQNKPSFKIYVGKANASMELVGIEITYLKLPEIVTLRDQDVYTFGEDNSMVIELPDYLKNEIVKRCTIYLLEKTSDPRVQTQPAFNQEIPAVPMSLALSGRQVPAQQQAQTQQTE